MLLKIYRLRNAFDKCLQMRIDGPWRNQSACLAPAVLSSYSHLNCIITVILYAFSPVQSTSVACGCWFVTCLAWGSASLGHSHSPEFKPTGKLINTQAPYQGLGPQLPSPATHICPCLGPSYIPTHLGRITASMFEEIPSRGLPKQAK